MGDDIRVFKIATGEEVITRVTDETETAFICDRPRVVAIAPGPGGQMSVTLIPLYASSQDGAGTIEKSMIVGSPNEINKKLENGYIQQTTGMALA